MNRPRPPSPTRAQSPSAVTHPPPRGISLPVPRPPAACCLGLVLLLTLAPRLATLAAEPAGAPGTTNPSPASPAPTSPLEVLRPTDDHRVDFNRELLPAFQANCLPCHNKTSSKGDLVLESTADMLQGGESGPALVPGKSADSLILKVASHAAKPRMPPRENKVKAVDFTPRELGLLARWIDQGATPGQSVPTTVAWQSVPTNFHPAYAVALSPDGRLVAGSRGNRVDLYRRAEPSLPRRLLDTSLGTDAAQPDIVQALAFSPDGNWLAAGGFREVRLWRRRPPAFLPFGAFTNVQAIEISPDHALVAVALANGTIQLAKPDSARVELTIAGLTTTTTHLRFSPNHQRLAAASADGFVRFWDTSTGSLLATHPGGSLVSALTWCAQGNLVALARENETSIALLELPALRLGRLKHRLTLVGHTNRIDVLEDAAPLGSLLASGSRDGTARLWPAILASATNPPPASIARVLDLQAPVTSIACLPGSRQLAVATQTQGTQLWSIEATNRPILRLVGDFQASRTAAQAERQLAFARSEFQHRSNSLHRADADLEKRTDEVRQATDKLQAAEKSLAEKKLSLQTQQETLAASQRDATESTRSLLQATNRYAASRKAADAARTAARHAQEQLANARLAAAQAAATATDLDRELAQLRAASNKGATNTAPEAALSRAVAAAESAARDRQLKTKIAEDARDAAEKATDALVQLATADGEAKAIADRALAETQPRIRQAEERSKNATKAIADLKPAIERAHIQRDTAEADLALAGRNSEAAKLQRETTRTALAQAVSALGAAEALARKATAARDAANARGHLWIHAATTTAAGPNPARLWTLDEESRLTLWSLPAGEPLVEYTLPLAAGEPVALLPDLTLLMPGPAGLARFAPDESWELARQIGRTDRPDIFVDRVNALAFSPDSRQLASAGGEPSRSGELKLWSVADGSLIRDLGALHSDCVLSVAYSPKGDLLASGGADRFLRLADPTTGRLVHSFEGHTHHVLGVAWRGDGREIASAGGEGTVKVWNAETYERLLNIDGFGKEVTAVQSLGLSLEFLAVAGSAQARVFRDNNPNLRTLPAGTAFLHCLSVTPDGRFAAAGAADGSLRVWDITENKLISQLPAIPAP